MTDLSANSSPDVLPPGPWSTRAGGRRAGALLRRLVKLPLTALRAHARRRRHAAELLQLDEHMLRDIGLTRAEVLARTGEPSYSDIGNLTFVGTPVDPRSRRT